VLVVDDVHAADNATVAILHVVARQAAADATPADPDGASNELADVAGRAP